MDKTVTIEYRWAEGRYDEPARIGRRSRRPQGRCDRATVGTPSALAAKSATSTIPIAFLDADPVGTGLVGSLARPGGYLTGFSIFSSELTPKGLELLSELVPQARVIALLVNQNSANCRAAHWRRAASDACEGGAAPYPEGQHRKRDRRRLCLPYRTACCRARRRRRSLPQQPARAARRTGGTLCRSSNQSQTRICGGRRPDSYGPSFTDTWRQLGIYAGRILKGEKPADLPVQQPTTFELVANLKTAKALGLTVPASILAVME
jgi:putative ABC transport system substrate-binding protein